MTPFTIFFHRWRRGALMLLALSAFWLQSCSILLDFDQCEANADCPSAGICVEGICQEVSTIEVSEHITEDTTWVGEKTYILKEPILVTEPAVLTIEAGTKILAEEGAALVAEAGAKVDALGTREAPIVFSSNAPAEQRKAGDWAGVTLIGKAPTNQPDFRLRIDDKTPALRVGGGQYDWDCGSLKYVRIEFAGAPLGPGEALGGLTLAGCGSDTEVDYIQAHKSKSDALKIHGGTVHAHHLVLTQAGENSLAIDAGWQGSAQFIAVQQSALGENSIEITNSAEDHRAEPLTTGLLYNYTLIGAKGGRNIQRGVYIKDGGAAHLSNGIIIGHHTIGVELDGLESIHRTASSFDDDDIISHTLFYDVGPDGETYGQGETCAIGGPDVEVEMVDCDSDEYKNHVGSYSYSSDLIGRISDKNTFGTDPGFNTPYNQANPDWVPNGTHTTGTHIPEPPHRDGFNPNGVYLGAFAPEKPPWTQDWTAYPAH